MDVAVSELRAQLSDWLARVRAGEVIVITERGLPVARLVGLESTSVIERLTAQGVISRPENPTRPRSSTFRVPTPRHPVSPLVEELRD